MSFCRMLICAVMPVLWLQLYHLLSLLLDLLNTELSLETKIPRVGRGRWRLYLLLHFCHYNDSCVKTGSGVRLFNVPFTVVGRVTRQYLQPTNHMFWWGRRFRMEWYWTLSAYQINTLLLGQSASPITYVLSCQHLGIDGFYRCMYWILLYCGIYFWTSLEVDKTLVCMWVLSYQHQFCLCSKCCLLIDSFTGLKAY